MGGHFADGAYLARLGRPQPERPVDVTVLIEVDRPSHSFIADRPTFGDELEGFGKLVLAGMNDFTTGRDDVVQCLL